MENKTLSAAQIRYLRIGPRVNQSKVLKQQLVEAVEEENKQQGSQFQNGSGTLNRIPKYGYSELSKTVNNFGVLINHNFGACSSLHQMQKFGKLAKQVDNIMQSQKDKPLQDGKKNSASRVNQKQDKRTFIKSIYNYQGQKIFAFLHSFSVQAIGQNYKEVFPFSEMKLLVSKVSSAKLSSVIESALRFQTESVQMNYQKLRQKAMAFTNSEQKYQNLGYKFEKIGTQFKINLPYLEFSHIESNFKHTAQLTNKDILDILSQQFDNVHDIVYKYFNHEGFSSLLDGAQNEQHESMHPVVEQQYSGNVQDSLNQNQGEGEGEGEGNKNERQSQHSNEDD